MTEQFKQPSARTTTQTLLERANKTKISQLSLPWFLFLSAIIYVGMYLEVLPVSMIGGLAILLSLGWLLGWIGGIIPGFKAIGGSTILSMLVPSAMVYFNVIPENALAAVNRLMLEADFQNLYVYTLVLGSIMSLNRVILIRGLTRMVIPMVTGFVLALLIPSLIGAALGIGFLDSLFFIVAPVMSGGLVVGVLPLAAGFSESSSALPYGELIALLLPGAIVGNLVTIAAAATLNQLGKRKPHLTGNGMLVKTGQTMIAKKEDVPIHAPLSHQLIGTGLYFLTAVVVFATMIHQLIPLPLAVIVILLCLIFKLFGLLPPVIESSSAHLNMLLSSIFTNVILVSIGIIHLDLGNVLAVLTWQYLVVIVSVVVTLCLTGFFIARFLDMYPIESAIVSLNQAAMGGMGNVAILASCDRDALMPFGHIATRISGAVTLSVMITLYQIFG